MGSFIQDLRFTFRTLARTPLVTGAVLLSLAVGIGANSTIFTLVNAVFLRSLPVAEPERLVAVFTTEEKQQFGQYLSTSVPNFEDLRDGTDVFSNLVAVADVYTSLVQGSGFPEQVNGSMVSGRYFEMLGVEALIGRTFAPEEDAQPVAVLSHRFWERRFGGFRGLVGRTITLNNQPFTVIGVMPPEFNGTLTLQGPDFWVPLSTRPLLLDKTFLTYLESRRLLYCRVLGRLAPGASMEQARSAVAALGRGLSEQYPEANDGRGFTALPLTEAAINPTQRERYVQAGSLMMSVVALILLIACINVANLLLGRAVARRREMAIRMSLGAKRRRIIGQLLTESVLLGLLSGALGLLLAHWGRSLLWSMRPPFLQNSSLDLSLDARVLGFTFLVSVSTGLLFGLAPALRASRPDIVHDLKESADFERGLGRLWTFKNALVAGQVAFSFVALIGSGLFLRSLEKATEIDLGFDPQRLGMMTFDLMQAGFTNAPRGRGFMTQTMERMGQLAGLEEVTYTNTLPLMGGGILRTVLVEGRDPKAPNNGFLTPVFTIPPEYFKTLRIELLAGRDLSGADRMGVPLVAIVNQAMAERFWPGEDPIGKRFRFQGQQNLREVVGVVATTKYQSLGEDPRPQVFEAFLQNYNPTITLVFRSGVDPSTLLQVIRQELRLLEPKLTITNVRPMSEAVQHVLWGPRMAAALLGLMGALALLLASVGIYSVMAYGVSQRRHEIGIRMAMGAQRLDVMKLILGQGMALVGLGLALGLVAAVAAGHRLTSMLYGVSPTDLVTLASTALILGLVALAANLLPAQRATGVNPVEVLRRER